MRRSPSHSASQPPEDNQYIYLSQQKFIHMNCNDYCIYTGRLIIKGESLQVIVFKVDEVGPMSLGIEVKAIVNIFQFSGCSNASRTPFG